ncbi:hypothetical protein M0813_10670 [Anaeramoeba flamelloides]|uniref:BZIP domain-containing protein n=1 Tax=Anaeramoeba flamelloides TaxID=1746091 RepID=A0ABQ8X606_9EUKA|nr:hypothetical protein M0813_10670 [Anaeramoeba flamelloides]
MDLSQLNFEQEEETVLLNVDDIFSFDDVSYQPLLLDDFVTNQDHSSPPTSPNEVLQENEEENNSNSLLMLLNQPIPQIKTEQLNQTQTPIQNNLINHSQQQYIKQQQEQQQQQQQQINQQQEQQQQQTKQEQQQQQQQQQQQIQQEHTELKNYETKPKTRTKKKIIKKIIRKKPETQKNKSTTITNNKNSSKFVKRGRHLKSNELEKRKKLASIRNIKNVKNLSKEERRLRRLERNRESARRTREKKKEEEFQQQQEISTLKSLVSDLKKEIDQKNTAISQLLNYFKKENRGQVNDKQDFSTLIQELSPLGETIKQENLQFSVSRKRRYEQQPQQSQQREEESEEQNKNVSHKKYKSNFKSFNKQNKKSIVGVSLFVFFFMVGICFNWGNIGENAGYDYSLGNIELDEKNYNHYDFSYVSNENKINDNRAQDGDANSYEQDYQDKPPQEQNSHDYYTTSENDSDLDRDSEINSQINFQSNNKS